MLLPREVYGKPSLRSASVVCGVASYLPIELRDGVSSANGNVFDFFNIVWEFIFEAFVAIDSLGGYLFVAFPLEVCISAFFFCHLFAYWAFASGWLGALHILRSISVCSDPEFWILVFESGLIGVL